MGDPDIAFEFTAPSEEKAELWWKILNDVDAAAEEYVGDDYDVDLESFEGMDLYRAWRPLLECAFFFDYEGTTVQMGMSEEYQHEGRDENGRSETRYGKAWGAGGKTPKQAAVKLKWYLKKYRDNIIEGGYSTDVMESNEALDKEIDAMLSAIDSAVKILIHEGA